jgi:cobalamin synthase
MSIDPRGPRFIAAVTTVVLAAVVLTGSVWLLLAQAVVFALGVAGRSPYGLVFARLVRPRIGPPSELEDARPVRFAQGVGLAFVLLALVAALAGSPFLAIALTAAALAAAFLNAAFGICLGCEIYLLLHRTSPNRKEVSA